MVRGVDGTIRLRHREEGVRWPENARCDLGVTSVKGPSAAVFLTESDVRMLIARLREHLDPPREAGARDLPEHLREIAESIVDTRTQEGRYLLEAAAVIEEQDREIWRLQQLVEAGRRATR